LVRPVKQTPEGKLGEEVRMSILKSARRGEESFLSLEKGNRDRVNACCESGDGIRWEDTEVLSKNGTGSEEVRHRNPRRWKKKKGEKKSSRGPSPWQA